MVFIFVFLMTNDNITSPSLMMACLLKLLSTLKRFGKFLCICVCFYIYMSEVPKKAGRDPLALELGEVMV